ncbi:CD44 antigen isoform X6 [Dasypus novemcinctus]|uniref:CD44 antigen isoform X6 n=1 Tax=Dasypus novemcinctus TaxID=9361 RepID=UPI00265E9DEF|nr:CD44 antigen isoform X7 [Dasypus novemcinctus]
MDTFWWRAAWGLFLLQLSLAQIDLNITCRYAGVYHVEKNGRYSISRTEAADLCKAFNSTLPTMAQMKRALSIGFETCRYGFIEGHVVIPRITPNAICAANNTGVYIVTSNTSQYDTYCFNASALPDREDCTSVTDLPNAFDGPITITIVNRDGTRYTQKGEYRTNPEDIHPSTPADEDVSSGSSSERSTSGGYIFHTVLPTADPTQDQGGPFFSTNTENSPATTLPSTSGTTPERATKRQEVQDWFSWLFQPSQAKNHLHTTKMAAQPLMQVTTTGMDSSTISTGWEPNEENEDGKENSPSYSGSGIDDDEDFIAGTISSTPLVNYTKENEDGTQWNPAVSHPEILLETATRMTDVDRSGTSVHGESWTQEPHHPLIHQEHHETTQPSTSTNMDSSYSTMLQPTADPNTDLTEDSDRTRLLSVTTQQSHSQSSSTAHGDLEEDKDHQTAPTSTSSTRNHGRRFGNPPEDATTSEKDYIPHSPDTKENRTLIPVTPAKTGSLGITDVNSVEDSNFNVDPSLSGDHDSPIGPSGGFHTTHGSESDGHSSGSREGGANTTSSPIRKSKIPEWLIILASLLALALILAVCIAVNSRRRCGQKKKLVINSGNGAVEDRKPSGVNGEASKSQEMVHLVNKESSETPDQFMTADETRNLQNVDMKIGV